MNGKQVDELRGANQRELKNKINQHKPAGVSGPGNKLGWDGVGNPPGPPVDPREARMKAFGSMGSSSTKPPPSAPPATSEEEEIAKAIALSMEEDKNNEESSQKVLNQMKELVSIDRRGHSWGQKFNFTLLQDALARGEEKMERREDAEKGKRREDEKKKR